MLDTFPGEALAQNWLSETLCNELLRELDHATQEQLEDFPHYVGAPYKEILERYSSISTRFKTLTHEIRKLNGPSKDLVRKALTTQNSLPAILQHDFEYAECSNELPVIHALAVDLFSTAFAKLSLIKSPGENSAIRDWHFDLIFNGHKKKACAGCGLEKLEAPDADIVRPDLDHYLAISRYPFAGVNLANLTPMGTMCNTKYKLDKDVLNSAPGSRTSAFDPYGTLRGSISLDGSRFLPSPQTIADWCVNIAPDDPMTTNWDRVFKIKLRYKNILKSDFDEWLAGFSDYVVIHKMPVNNQAETIAALASYVATCRLETLPAIATLKTLAMQLFRSAMGSAENGARIFRFFHNFHRNRTSKEYEPVDGALIEVLASA